MWFLAWFILYVADNMVVVVVVTVAPLLFTISHHAKKVSLRWGDRI
jgi:hypothetical protein